MKKDPYSKRSHLLALFFRYTGLVLVLLSFSDFFFLDITGCFLGTEIFGTLAVLFLIIAAGLYMILLSGRLDAPSAKEILADDPRPPVLYLRSFGSDRSWGTPSGIELQMRFELSVIGPVVAIGRPGDVLPIIGVPRKFLKDDDNWEDYVKEWMSRAALVVFRVGTSSGLCLEMMMAFKNLAPKQIVIIIPGKKAWKEFLGWANDTLPVILPEHTGNACLLLFDDDWHPKLIYHPFSQKDKEWYEYHEVWNPITERFK